MSWDEYFFRIAQVVASNSKCLSRQIGAVLVKDKFIVSTGYNGPPAGVEHCADRNMRWAKDGFLKWFPIKDFKRTCTRRLLGYESGEGLNWCPAAHAERNAIDIAARLGHSTEGCTLYLTWLIPCLECAKSIINAGIVEVVVGGFGSYDKEGITGKELLEGAKVKIRLYDFLEEEGE